MISSPFWYPSEIKTSWYQEYISHTSAVHFKSIQPTLPPMVPQLTYFCLPHFLHFSTTLSIHPFSSSCILFWPFRSAFLFSSFNFNSRNTRPLSLSLLTLRHHSINLQKQLRQDFFSPSLYPF